MIKKIVTAEDPVLREKSKTVKKFGKKLQSLVEDMFNTLDAQIDPEGVGLAAVQIGVLKRVFVLYEDVRAKKIKRVFVNPIVISTKKGKYNKENEPLEGCLSIPHYYGPLIRERELVLEYQDIKGEKKTEGFKGFIAQVILHEIDHLEGKLFIDRLLQQDAPLYEHKKGKWYEVDL